MTTQTVPRERGQKLNAELGFRRKWTRFPVCGGQTNVEVTFGKTKLDATLVNLSGGGMCVRVRANQFPGKQAPEVGKDLFVVHAGTVHCCVIRRVQTEGRFLELGLSSERTCPEAIAKRIKTGFSVYRPPSHRAFGLILLPSVALILAFVVYTGMGLVEV